jgi:hypothetical protein
MTTPPARLTADEERAIRERVSGHTQVLWHLHAHRDLNALLAELDALRAENKRLRDEAFQLEHGWKIG